LISRKKSKISLVLSKQKYIDFESTNVSPTRFNTIFQFHAVEI